MTAFRHACDAFDALPWSLVAALGMFLTVAYLVIDAVWGPR